MRRLGLVLREMFHGVFHNITMTLAVIITVAVSLTLFGTGLLVNQQVSVMKDYWYDRVEVSVFLCGNASDPAACPNGPVTAPQRDAIKAKLAGMTSVVEQVYYESSQEAYERFKQQFKDSPILGNVTADAMPESFRVKLVNAEDYGQVATAVHGMPGVEQVQDQRKLLDKFFRLLNGLQAGAMGVAIAMLIVTVLLVINTMRMAAFNRRRETAIMKLVGASNTYVRMPFVLEAAFLAAVGGVLAVGALAAEKIYLIDRIMQPSFRFTAFIGWQQVRTVMIIVFVVGVLLASVAAIGSVRRYLRV